MSPRHYGWNFRLGTLLLVALILVVFLGPIVFLSWKGWRAWTNIADP